MRGSVQKAQLYPQVPYGAQKTLLHIMYPRQIPRKNETASNPLLITVMRIGFILFFEDVIDFFVFSSLSGRACVTEQ